MILKLMINEITPEQDDTPVVNYSTVFLGDELNENIHTFFSTHVRNILMHPKTRNGRFKNEVSTILNSVKHLLNVVDPVIAELAITVDGVVEEEIIGENTDFETHSKIITDQLARNISKNVKNPFLFIVLHFEHEVHGELIALIKMERIFGVQFTRDKLRVQLDMLPDKERDLQKCALIFKNKLIELNNETTLRGNNDPNKHHTKILDRQDNTISQYFMTSFLDNVIITKDKENTKLASKHITSELLSYAITGINRKEIKDYVENSLQLRKETSLEILIEDIIQNSGFIDSVKLDNENVDTNVLRYKIYNSMLADNESAQQSFISDPDYIEKKLIKDISSNGKELKISIAQVIIDTGKVKYDFDSTEILPKEEWMKIAIKRDIIETEE